MKTINWIFFNGLFATILYVAFGLGFYQAENVVLVYSWFLFVISFSYLSKDVHEKIARNGRSVPRQIDVLFDVCVVITLLWNSWVWTGVAYLVHFVLHTYGFAEGEKMRNERKNNDPHLRPEKTS